MSDDAESFSATAVIEDHEHVARSANVRLWWRRAIVLTLVVLIGAPLSGAVVWWIRFGHLQQVDFNPPGEYGRFVRRAYSAYMRTEGHGNRGPLFEECAEHVQAFAGYMTEAEVLYYLGPPTTSISSESRTDHVYEYRRVRPGDSHVLVSVVPTSDGKRKIGAVHVNARVPAPKLAPPATTPSLSE